MKRLLAKFGQLNLMGEEVEITLDNDGRLYNWYTLIASIVTIILTSAFAFLFITKGIDPNSSEINTQYKTLVDAPGINLYDNSFFLAVFPIQTASEMDLTVGPLSYFTMFGVISKKKFVRDETGDIIDVDLQFIPMSVSQCQQAPEQLIKVLEKEGAIGKLVLETSLCVYPEKREDYFIKGGAIDDEEVKVEVSISPCSLPDPTICKGIDRLRSLQLLTVYPNPNLDLTSLRDILELSLNSDFILPVDLTNTQNINIVFRNVEVFDNKNEIFNDGGTMIKQFARVDNAFINRDMRDPTQIHCPISEVFNKALCQPYHQFYLSSHGKTEIITRNFTGIFKIMSEIGGFNQILVSLFAIVCFFYGGTYLRWRIRSQLFSKEIQEKDKEVCDGIVRDRLNVIKILEDIITLKTANKIFFKDHHTVLIADVLAKMKTEDEKRENERSKKNFKILFSGKISQIQIFEAQKSRQTKRREEGVRYR